MKRHIVLSTTVALIAIGAGAAHAAPNDQRGWYGGIDLGRSNSKLNGGDIDGAFANQGITGTTSMDRHDTSLGLNLGFRVNRNFALEGGYTDFGKFNYSTAATAPAADTISGDYQAHAWSLAAVGIAPLNDKWSLFGKAGLTRVTADLSAGSASGALAPGNGSHSNTGFLVGGGATYDFTKRIYGKAEIDRYTRAGDMSTGRGDIDLYTVGVGVRF